MQNINNNISDIREDVKFNYSAYQDISLRFNAARGREQEYVKIANEHLAWSFLHVRAENREMSLSNYMHFMAKAEKQRVIWTALQEEYQRLTAEYELAQQASLRKCGLSALTRSLDVLEERLANGRVRTGTFYELDDCHDQYEHVYRPLNESEKQKIKDQINLINNEIEAFNASFAAC